jgi:anti-anti-sigma factor
MNESLTEKCRRDLVLDLGEERMLTAGGLGQLVALNRRLRASGGRLVLCNVGGKAYEVLQVTRLTELLDVRRRPALVVPPAGAIAS